MTAQSDLVERYVACFEQLAPERLESLTDLFAVSARFKDPFNDVKGRDAIRRVFEHMFTQLSSPRFRVTAQAVDGNVAMLHWYFSFRSRGRGSEKTIEGMSLVLFDGDGLVAEHVDHWDPAEQIYAEVPLLGFLLERIKRHLSAG